MDSVRAVQTYARGIHPADRHEAGSAELNPALSIRPNAVGRDLLPCGSIIDKKYRPRGGFCRRPKQPLGPTMRKKETQTKQIPAFGAAHYLRPISARCQPEI